MPTDNDGAGRGRVGRSGSSRRRTPSWIYWAASAAAVLAVSVVTVSSRRSAAGQASGDAPGEQRISAPDFRLTLYQGAEELGGEELEFSSLFGQGKPVVLNFWAGLCPPCRAEMPDFQQVYDELDGQFILLGLDIGPFTGLGSREDGQRLLRELGITYPAGTTFEEITVAEYRVRGMPTTVFLSAAGEIVDTHIGLLDERTLRAKVESLLQGGGGS